MLLIIRNVYLKERAFVSIRMEQKWLLQSFCALSDRGQAIWWSGVELQSTSNLTCEREDSWEGLIFHVLSTKIFMWPMYWNIYAIWMVIRRPWLLRWYHRLIPVWISNHVPYNVHDEITYTFQTSTATPFKFGNGRAGALVTPFCGMYLVFSLNTYIGKISETHRYNIHLHSVSPHVIYNICRLPYRRREISRLQFWKRVNSNFKEIDILEIDKQFYGYENNFS